MDSWEISDGKLQRVRSVTFRATFTSSDDGSQIRGTCFLTLKHGRGLGIEFRVVPDDDDDEGPRGRVYQLRADQEQGRRVWSGEVLLFRAGNHELRGHARELVEAYEGSGAYEQQSISIHAVLTPTQLLPKAPKYTPQGETLPSEQCVLRESPSLSVGTWFHGTARLASQVERVLAADTVLRFQTSGIVASDDVAIDSAFDGFRSDIDLALCALQLLGAERASCTSMVSFQVSPGRVRERTIWRAAAPPEKYRASGPGIGGYAFNSTAPKVFRFIASQNAEVRRALETAVRQFALGCSDRDMIDRIRHLVVALDVIGTTFGPAAMPESEQDAILKAIKSALKAAGIDSSVRQAIYRQKREIFGCPYTKRLEHVLGKYNVPLPHEAASYVAYLAKVRNHLQHTGDVTPVLVEDGHWPQLASNLSRLVARTLLRICDVNLDDAGAASPGYIPGGW